MRAAGGAALAALTLFVASSLASAGPLEDLIARFEREKKADSQTRLETIREIGKLKTEAAARFLIRVVETDEDRSVRMNTIYQFAPIPLPLCWKALLEFYEDEDLRSSAFSAIVSYRQEKLPEKMIAGIRASTDQGLRSNLIRYFGRRKDPRMIPEAEQFLADFPNGTTSLISPLTQNPSPEAGRLLVQIYDDDRQYDREQVPKMFASAEPEVRAVLAEAIAKASPKVAMNAAIIAGRAKVTEAEPAVVAMEGEAKEPELRATLLETIGALGGSTAEGREALVRALSAPNDVVIGAGIRGLRGVRSKEAVPALIGVMRREEGVLRIEAYITLERLTGQQFGDRLDLWEAWWHEFGESFDPAEVKGPDPDTLSQALIDLAIEKGAAVLREMRGKEKPWEYAGHPLGTTGLVLLALQAAGPRRRDRDIAAAVKYLRDSPVPERTYDLGLVAMALEVVDPKRHRRRIAECAKRLIELQNDYGYWGYPTGDGDHSNTQYAVLGLRSAARAGVKIPQRVWVRIRNHFYETRNEDGGWSYTVRNATTSSSSMTSAGVTCLLVCYENMELSEEERTRLEREIDEGFTALGKKMKLDKDTLYALYGIERAGVLGSRALMDGKPWYVPGARRLVAEQGRNGVWRGNYEDAVETAFAILFLKKATAPISSR